MCVINVINADSPPPPTPPRVGQFSTVQIVYGKV